MTKDLTLDNVFEEDSRIFSWEISGMKHSPSGAKAWIEAALKLKIADFVPSAVREQFDRARAIAVYAPYYYPLFTLCHEECMRTIETFVHYAATEVSNVNERASAKKKLQVLLENKIIDAKKFEQLCAGIELRNFAAHKRFAHTLGPQDAIGDLFGVKQDAEAIFRQIKLRELLNKPFQTQCA